MQLVLLLGKLAGVSFNTKLIRLLENRISTEEKSTILKQSLLLLFLDKEVKQLLFKLATLDPFTQDIHSKLAQDPDLLKISQALKSSDSYKNI